MALAAKDRKKLRADGYVVLRGIVPKPLLAAARRAIDANVARGRHASMDAHQDSRDYWSEDTYQPAIMDLLHESPLWALSEALIGKGKLSRPSTGQIAIRFPAEGNSHSGPVWHVDGFYGNGKPAARFTLLAGILLSDAPKPFMGNLAVCPGSHLQIAKHLKKHGLDSLTGRLSDTLDLPEPVQVTGKAGDVILAHYQLAHDKEQNLSKKTRYMAYFRLRHLDCDTGSTLPLTDLWKEFPGL